MRMLLVYSESLDELSVARGSDMDVDRMSPNSVEIISQTDRGPNHKFYEQWIALGYDGIALRRGDDVLSYGWIATPTSPPPPHLLQSVIPQSTCWIFSCRTPPRHRGNGYYTLLLQRLRELRRTEWPDCCALIDTAPDNVPARKAIIRAGFVPQGCLRIQSLAVPRLYSRVLWATWSRDLGHPVLGMPA